MDFHQLKFADTNLASRKRTLLAGIYSKPEKSLIEYAPR
jgi:hypothetical protein